MLTTFCKQFCDMKNIFRITCVLTLALLGPSTVGLAVDDATCDAHKAAFGAAVFRDPSFSKDGQVKCQTCHDPVHSYAENRARSVGNESRIGTRNAPSLIGISLDESFFWDGRRTRLDEVVLDPFTNPVELGLSSQAEIVDRARLEPALVELAKSAFPAEGSKLGLQQIQQGLVCFIRSLSTGSSVYDNANSERSSPLPSDAERGRQLFVGLAGCSECHRTDNGRFTDNQYHHSGIEQNELLAKLPALTKAVLAESPRIENLGPKILADADWSALGRFVVSRRAADIGAFRTPSLRNVALTAPYMHDGSVKTLAEAVDREIYYRAFSTGRTVNLSQQERDALVAFLNSLTDK
jgi:cytochrome c peroxidase